MSFRVIRFRGAGFGSWLCECTLNGRRFPSPPQMPISRRREFQTIRVEYGSNGRFATVLKRNNESRMEWMEGIRTVFFPDMPTSPFSNRFYRNLVPILPKITKRTIKASQASKDCSENVPYFPPPPGWRMIRFNRRSSIAAATPGLRTAISPIATSVRTAISFPKDAMNSEYRD